MMNKTSNNSSGNTEEYQSVTATVNISATQKEVTPLLCDLEMIQKYHPLVDTANIVFGQSDGVGVGAVRRLTFKSYDEDKELGKLPTFLERSESAAVTLLEKVTEMNVKRSGIVDHVRFELSEYDDEAFPCDELFAQFDTTRTTETRDGNTKTKEDSPKSSTFYPYYEEIDTSSFTVKFDFKLKEQVAEKEAIAFIGEIEFLAKLVASGAKDFVENNNSSSNNNNPIITIPTTSITTTGYQEVLTTTKVKFSSVASDPVTIFATQEDVAPLMNDLKKIEQYHPFMEKGGASIVFWQDRGVGAVRRLTYNDENKTTFLEQVTEVHTTMNGVVDRVRFELAEIPFPFIDRLFGTIESKDQTEGEKKGLSYFSSSRPKTSFSVQFEYTLKEGFTEEDAKPIIDAIAWLAQGIANKGKELVEREVATAVAIVSEDANANDSNQAKDIILMVEQKDVFTTPMGNGEQQGKKNNTTGQLHVGQITAGGKRKYEDYYYNYNYNSSSKKGIATR